MAAAIMHWRRPYYGWWIVLSAGLSQFVSTAFTTVLLSVVLTPMTTELGWTRTEFTSGRSVAAVLAAFAALFIGPMVDRHGSRPLMLAGTLAFGATLLATGWVTELWQFIALQLVAGVFARPLIGGVVVNVPLSKWFVLRRGWAIALASSGFSFSTMLAPVAVTAVVTGIGWREAYVFLGLVFLALMLPASLVMRRQPEDYGLLPDGQREADEAASEADRAQLERLRRDSDNSYTRREALRTSAFWLLTIAFGLAVAANISMLFHAIPYMTDSGFSPADAGFALGLTGVTGLVAKFTWGATLQRVRRFGPRHFAALAFVATGVGDLLLVVATNVGSIPVALLGFLFWGFGFGSVTPLQEFMWAGYFGRRYLGAVRSAAVPVTIGATALGPLLVALWFDLAGTYDGAFIAMVITYAICAIVILASHEPSPRTPAEPSEPGGQRDAVAVPQLATTAAPAPVARDER